MTAPPLFFLNKTKIRRWKLIPSYKTVPGTLGHDSSPPLLFFLNKTKIGRWKLIPSYKTVPGTLGHDSSPPHFFLKIKLKSGGGNWYLPTRQFLVHLDIIVPLVFLIVRNICIVAFSYYFYWNFKQNWKRVEKMILSYSPRYIGTW